MADPTEETKPDAANPLVPEPDAPRPRHHASSSSVIQKLKANPWDGPGAIAAAVVTILGALHIPERLELSANDVAVIGGAVATLAATVRGWLIYRRVP